MNQNTTKPEDPDEFIINWLNQHPDRAVKIAHAALYGMFVEHDDLGQAFLSASNIPDSNDIFAELAPVVDASSFAQTITNLN